MIIKIKKINSILLYVYFLLFILTILTLKQMGSLSNYILIINLTIQTMLLLFNKDKISKKSLLLCLCLTALIIISSFANKNGIGSIINTVSFIVGILIFQKYDLQKNEYIFIIIVLLILFLYNFILSFNVWDSYLNQTNDLNPNSVAIFLGLSVIGLCNIIKKNKYKILFLLCGIIGIINAECRSALVACVIYLILSYFPLLKNAIIKNKKKILLLIIIVGLLFPIAYVNLYNQGIHFDLSFSEKKFFTGRERIWGYMLETLKLERYGYYLGVGSNYLTAYGKINNYHNWYIGILYTFGSFVFVLYFSFLLSTIIKLKNKNIIIAFIIFFILGFFETMGLWGTTQCYFYIFMLISNYESKDS